MRVHVHDGARTDAERSNRGINESSSYHVAAFAVNEPLIVRCPSSLNKRAKIARPITRNALIVVWYGDGDGGEAPRLPLKLITL